MAAVGSTPDELKFLVERLEGVIFVQRRRESAEVRALGGPHHAAVLPVPRHQLQGRAAAAAGRALERHLDIDIETRA